MHEIFRLNPGKKRDKTAAKPTEITRAAATKRVSTFEMMRRIQIGAHHRHINSPYLTNIFSFPMVTKGYKLRYKVDICNNTCHFLRGSVLLSKMDSYCRGIV